MFQAMGNTIYNFDLSKVVLAVGALGTAAYGLVDITKAFGGDIPEGALRTWKDEIRNVVPVRPVIFHRILLWVGRRFWRHCARTG
jgi:hypothetical protein